MTEKKNRFPGAKPFNVQDKDVFYGRTEDVERLYELLNLKRMIVLYAASGIGKSSLVNAGLLPKCEETGNGTAAKIIRVRFGLQHDSNKIEDGYLVKQVIDELKIDEKDFVERKFPFVDEGLADSLWYHIKLFEKNNHKVLMVFDQFEEVFSYSALQVKEFKEQVYSIFGSIPKSINDRLTDKVNEVDDELQEGEELAKFERDLKFIYAPLNTQVLYVIREDKLGYFNVFVDYFPDILKDTFKLLPLSRKGAKDAISLPASKEGSFKTDPFTFTHQAINILLKRLDERNETYDPFTIQLTCRYIEQSLEAKNGVREVAEADIPEVNIIVKDFVENAWKALPVKGQMLEQLKEKIETQLIAFDIQKRVSVHEGEWLDCEISESLINAGLLKRDRRADVDYIELSHDRLVAPLIDDFELRRARAIEKKKTRKRSIVQSVVVIAALAVGIWFVIEETKEHKLQQLELQKVVQRNARKDSIIENLEQTVSNESADSLSKKAVELVQNNDLKAATTTFNLAINDAIEAKNPEKVKLLHRLKSKYLPDSATNKVTSDVFRIDVFYDERFLDEAELAANRIVKLLSTNSKYIVRKKMLTTTKINSNRTWDIKTNIIRHERHENERKLAKVLVTLFNKDEVLAKLGNSFSTEVVRSSYSSPNYISIFVTGRRVAEAY